MPVIGQGDKSGQVSKAQVTFKDCKPLVVNRKCLGNLNKLHETYNSLS